ncbi:hypothetical protein [Isoptericola rhizosphaerae]|uniref:hypothetical protein n=1 Tax=Isoptericola rhizosphaerae TaxID=3377837 RepID=UPI00383B16B9
MSARKRMSLKEREQAAIHSAPAEHIASTRQDKPRATLERDDTESTPAEPPSPVPAPAPMSKVPATRAPEGQRRLGTYWQKETFNEARAAYVVDLDSLSDPPVGFARWVEAAIRAHTARTPSERADVAASLGEEYRSGSGVQRSILLAEATIADAEHAVVDDRRAGRVQSLSQFVTEAARHAIADTRARYGRELPPPPPRLPTRPSR